jgi:hypothetical protein
MYEIHSVSSIRADLQFPIFLLIINQSINHFRNQLGRQQHLPSTKVSIHRALNLVIRLPSVDILGQEIDIPAKLPQILQGAPYSRPWA